jgi:hypothetical protein
VDGSGCLSRDELWKCMEAMGRRMS